MYFYIKNTIADYVSTIILQISTNIFIQFKYSALT